ncbi:hypothetical protein DFP72DRAFT_1045742 [Ephemerocybe angulata]|uniref:Nephrocystin 3-like N-terminal domain-containing protein n=1 Tax=Ephemerocybe angulata TaxID=980116 RepID=A0A8H6HX86_9AGAR|nr:hypothetical protein DFP72DRAFT_1045742 [Tulosesus angulatus]
MATTVHTTLQNAHDFTIDSLVQVNAKNYINHAPASGPSREATLRTLLREVAVGAVHDSAERCDAPKCMPETRVAVQEEILSWISHGDSDVEPRKVLWVTGPAGTGKTAILGTVADDCKEKGLLAASFFFSSFSASSNRRSKRCFVSTLAYQLIQHPSFRRASDHVLTYINNDPSIFYKRLAEQLDVLILRPLQKLRGDPSFHPDEVLSWPKVIFIDGLDECEAEQYHDPRTPGKRRSKEDDQVEILITLMQAINDPAFPFRIVIASRPERAIRDFFTNLGDELSLELFLDDKYNPDADVALFLRSKFSNVRRRFKLPQNWPSDDVIQLLVQDASGQFVYAATVMRFIEDPAQHPHAQLECVLKSRPADDGSKPFAALDALYTTILLTSPNPKTAVLWVRALPTESTMRRARFFFHFYSPEENIFQSPSALFVNQLFESIPGEAEYVLGTLSSLIHIPSPDDQVRPYTFHHKSFLDFIDDDERCGDLYVDRDTVLKFYRLRWFQILKDHGPAMHLSTEDQDVFLRRFMQLQSKVFAFPSKASFVAAEPYLLSAPAAWWAEKIIETRSAYDSDRVAGPLDNIFRSVHNWCSPCKCRDACKHWRKGIIAVCKARGWIIPGKMELMRNRWKRDSAIYSIFRPGPS